MSTYDWQTSSYCGTGNNCLAIATSPDGSACLRESETPDAILTTSRPQLSSLIRAIKAGNITSTRTRNAY
ncbi:DUF397 domain-containing protein [Streptomyces sp. NPDC052496]|uniref:DUF397 domain-containing protein n=1 Tax=Streptomyces sp. NPDC052496 TaxID=3154951 RepID=UPI0034452E74